MPKGEKSKGKGGNKYEKGGKSSIVRRGDWDVIFHSNGTSRKASIGKPETTQS